MRILIDAGLIILGVAPLILAMYAVAIMNKNMREFCNETDSDAK